MKNRLSRSVAAKENFSQSKIHALNEKRGIVLPSEYGFTEEEDFDVFGRPKYVNPLTIANYYRQDILAADRLFQPETNKQFPAHTFQRIILREIFLRKFLFMQILRGGSKTTSVARALLDYALLVPNTQIALIAPTYRQSLFVFDEMVKLIQMNGRNKNVDTNVANEIVGDPRRGTMDASFRLHNLSSFKAVPLGEGQGIRGLRGGVIFLDEAYQFTEESYSSHIAPIAQVKQGGQESKIIMASTSWYQDCFMYKRMMQMAAEIKAGNPDYGILDFNLEDLLAEDTVAVLEGDRYRLEKRKFPLSESIWKDAQKHSDRVTYAMTYYNLWPDTHARWYEQSFIDDAISVRHGVRIEMKSLKDAKTPYFMVIDLASSEKGDSTCILVAKVEDGVAKYVWGKKGRGWNSHRRVWEVHEAFKKFNPTYIVYDSHGAIGDSFRQDASLPQLVVQDDAGNTDVKEVQPFVHWNQYNKRGRNVLIPASLKDDAVILALTGDRLGQIEGEDGFNNLLHLKTREFLWDGKILGPHTDCLPSLSIGEASKTQYEGSAQDALDVVRESFIQLGKISLDKNLDGSQKMTKKGQLIFKKKDGASVDDGAYCLIYGCIAYIRLTAVYTDGRYPAEKRAMVLNTNDILFRNQDPNDNGRMQKINFL